MSENLGNWQKLGQDNLDRTMQSFGALGKGLQAVAVEYADYSRKSFEDGATAVEKLLGAKSMERAVEVSSEYTRNAYETFMSKASKFGELYADIARDAYRPFESMLGRTPR